ncbi:Uma2 family endonuclease [Trichothermofontia sichuanensis B231]|uniref:Uma2 family endonuclease n=1 Tax=Trichothermofontia sichuanensis TaxID=3045816 RepID=UPI002246C198|nr:Uma2 family endonuclease [Trichothermofontia sichuanensis]UZQ52939.1 Uma2 family endonuclease [Trichothermofontia sichuanensis B231]
MLQAVPELMTLEAFLNWYPDGYGRYELWNGVVITMQPTGTHEQVGGFLGMKLGVEIDRLALPYLIPRQVIVKPLDTDKSGYNPDVIILDQAVLSEEPLWKQRSTITQGKSVRVVIEVVSTNWRDDYGHKFIDYEALGIPEYWIVDYLGLGGSRYIGSPKEPTLSVYQLVNGEYQGQLFRGSDRILSVAFPELNLTAEQVFAAGI